MNIEIFDVAHGACAVVTGPTGEKVMVDCGYNPDRPWFPSVTYIGASIKSLVISNFDEDHVSDFKNLIDLANVQGIHHNKTITPAALLSMKPDGIGAGTGAL